jgi:hypothetical protein
MSGPRPATVYYKIVQVRTTCRRPTTLTLTFLSYPVPSTPFGL